MRLPPLAVIAGLAIASPATAQAPGASSPLRPLPLDEASLSEFGRLSHATESPRGDVLLVDQTTSRLYVFDRTGRLRCAAGSRGSGPGSFQVVTGVWWSSGGFLAFDGATNRITAFNESCGLVDSRATPSLRGSPAQVVAVTSSGTLLLAQFDRSAVVADGLVSRDLLLGVSLGVNPATAVGSVRGSFVYHVTHGQATTSYDVPFLGRALFAGLDSGFAYVEREGRELQLRSVEWGLTTKVMLPVSDGPFERETVTKHRDSLLAVVSRGGGARFPGARERIEFAFGDRFPSDVRRPYIAEVRSHRNLVFLRPHARRGEPQDWIVLRAPGNVLFGSVRVPPGTRIIGAGSTGLYGVRADSDDVEVPVLIGIIGR